MAVNSLVTSKASLAIVDAVETSLVTLLTGYPDSKLDTMVPLWLYKAGFTESRTCARNPPRICVVHDTDARALAAAESMSVLLHGHANAHGKRKSSSLVFFDLGPPYTKPRQQNSSEIVYTTVDAVFTRVLSDPLLCNYSVIIIDDAQERRLANDVLMAILKRIQGYRPRLRLVVLCQGLQVPALYSFFVKAATGASNCGLVPVANIRLPRAGAYEAWFLSIPSSNFLDTIVSTVLNLCKQETKGNILVLVPTLVHANLLYTSFSKNIVTRYSTQVVLLEGSSDGENEKPNRVANEYSGKQTPSISSSSPNVQQGYSRVLYICCNTRDLSFVPGQVSYIVDALIRLHVKGGLVACTRSDSIARASICKIPGGTSKSFRLVPEPLFNDPTYVPVHAQPESNIHDLAWSVLLVKSLGVDKLCDFDFITRPNTDDLASAVLVLFLLGAVDANGDCMWPMANVMAELRMNIFTSAFLVKSTEFGCSMEAVTICAMMQIGEEIWHGGSSGLHAEQKAAAKLSFAATQGDLASLFNVYQLSQFYKDEDSRWLSRHMVNSRALLKAELLRKHLLKLLNKYELPVVTCGENVDLLVDTIFSSFFYNVACKEHIMKNYLAASGRGYEISTAMHLTDVEGRLIDTGDAQPYLLVNSRGTFTQHFISPDSFIVQESPDWIVFADTVTPQGVPSMRYVTAVSPQFLKRLVPQYFGNLDHNHEPQRTSAFV